MASSSSSPAGVAIKGVAAASIPKVILGSALGTMIEWYDFYIFGSLATVLSLKFYPPGNDTFALIAYLATFAVGFLVRPFGALFFGRLGDLVGRRIGLPSWDSPPPPLACCPRITRQDGFLPSF